MSRRRQPGPSSRQRPSEPLREKGLQALVVAGALWGLSLFLSSNPMLASAGLALRSLVWVPVAIGLGLLGFHVVLKRTRAGKFSNPASRNTGGAPLGRREPQLIEPLPTSTPGPAANSPAEDATKDQPPEKAMAWSPDVFAAIEWRRFEAVVETLFAQAGFETRSQSHGADGGVDIWLYSRNAEGPVSVVQCKHWQGKPVTVKEMREFLGVMVSKGVKRGTYATTSRYTADAMEFAKAHSINAQDGTGLLRLIAQRPPEQQASLLAVAYEGEYWKPTCASCGVKMTDRQSRKDGSHFWGCVNYPGCKRTLVMKTS